MLRSGDDIEREVRIESDHKSQALLMRVRASRTVDGTIDGIVLRAAPILSLEETPIGVSETMRDIADRKRAEEHKELLTLELAHRTKNLLSLVKATMAQTAQHTAQAKRVLFKVLPTG